LIFIIFIADCEDWIVTGKLQCYADDSFLTVKASSIEELKAKLEEEGSRVLEYFASNNLIANAEKSDLLIFRPSKETIDISIQLNGTEIQESKVSRILGVQVSRNLKWKTHREKLAKDVNYRIGKLARLSRNLGTRELKMIAHGLVNSKLRYCLSTYGSDALRLSESDSKNAEMKALQTLQNKMARTILHITPGEKARTSDILSKLDLLSINQLCALDVLMAAWNAKLFGIDPLQDFDNKKQAQKSLRYQARGDVRTDYSSPQSFPHIAHRLWNMTSNRFRTTNLAKVAKEEARILVKQLPI